MNDLVIKKTLETPAIEFIISKRYLLIEGRSIPENSMKFYEPLLFALTKYSEASGSFLKVDFKFEYFNTSSSKCILDILRILEKINLENAKVNISWYYEEDDEEILEIGQDFSQFVKIPFKLKMIPNN